MEEVKPVKKQKGLIASIAAVAATITTVILESTDIIRGLGAFFRHLSGA